uniref:Uncharacterized protein n=1 Tax=Setaria viridis TaxID=4556 RepID=A0A4U6T0F9_SETVI|nr:hypothetical protein SEVIR_9G333850v2 [Setaria viridis]
MGTNSGGFSRIYSSVAIGTHVRVQWYYTFPLHEGSNLSNLFSNVCMDMHAYVCMWCECSVRGCVLTMYV